MNYVKLVVKNVIIYDYSLYNGDGNRLFLTDNLSNIHYYHDVQGRCQDNFYHFHAGLIESGKSRFNGNYGGKTVIFPQFKELNFIEGPSNHMIFYDNIDVYEDMNDEEIKDYYHEINAKLYYEKYSYIYFDSILINNIEYIDLGHIRCPNEDLELCGDFEIKNLTSDDEILLYR